MPPDDELTRAFRLSDGRLLIADLDPAVPPARSPLRRALRTSGGRLTPTHLPTAGEPGEDGTEEDAGAGDGGERDGPFAG
ncbi:hypothetical protein [uncultured Streptomyces sp.]|uniref:hypothetical protein n=1 Tax=uncultured Streptomyces sp. TaxID=174707 RepID=UPI002613CAB7|nr:hypothetical protein [uncultured Streptomyces sp.]